MTRRGSTVTAFKEPTESVVTLIICIAMSRQTTRTVSYRSCRNSDRA